MYDKLATAPLDEQRPTASCLLYSDEGEHHKKRGIDDSVDKNYIRVVRNTVLDKYVGQVQLATSYGYRPAFLLGIRTGAQRLPISNLSLTSASYLCDGMADIATSDCHVPSGDAECSTLRETQYVSRYRAEQTTANSCYVRAR